MQPFESISGPSYYSEAGIPNQLVAEVSAEQLGVTPASLIWSDPGRAANMILQNLVRDGQQRKQTAAAGRAPRDPDFHDGAAGSQRAGRVHGVPSK